MAICPKCKNSVDGENVVGTECPICHHYFVESRELAKAPEEHLLGELVGDQYIPLSLIGEGGMGQIYKAKAKYTGKIVALKILKSEYMEDEQLKDRFFREAEVISQLDHPNIVKLYGCAPDPKHNTIFIAMELLTGKTLFDTLRRGAPRLDLIIQWFVEMSDALGAAHKKGIFHRDLKPENIFIVPSDDGKHHARILDFGFARLQGAAKKLTLAGVAFGTPHYMSPEQAMGMDEITAAVDVYALGIMLFQTITGHVPYDSATGSPMEVMYAQVHSPTPPIEPRPDYANVPQSLIQCIQKCMEKAPADRYADGAELHEALVAIQKEIQSGSASPSIASQAPVAPSAPGMPSAPLAPQVSVVGVERGMKLSTMTLVIIGIFLVLLIVIVVLLVKLVFTNP